MSYQEVVLQVIMSKEFNVLDKQIKTDLKKIYDGGNKDIGQLATNIRDLFDSSNNEAIYPLQYAKICNKTTVNEASLYFTEKEASLTTDNIQKFLYGQKTGDIQYLSCQELVNKKLIAYKESAWLLGESALVKSFLNDKHTYIRKLKDQYEKFLNKWTIYVGQLGVIKDKWPSKTKKVQ